MQGDAIYTKHPHDHNLTCPRPPMPQSSSQMQMHDKQPPIPASGAIVVHVLLNYATRWVGLRKCMHVILGESKHPAAYVCVMKFLWSVMKSVMVLRQCLAKACENVWIHGHFTP